MSAKTKMHLGMIYDAHNDAGPRKAPQDNGRVLGEAAMRIDQTVQHIADSSIRSIIDLSNAEGSQKGIIRAGGNTYNVTVSENGKVNVSFKGGWFNFLRKDSLQRMQARMQTDYADGLRQFQGIVCGEYGQSPDGHIGR